MKRTLITAIILLLLLGVFASNAFAGTVAEDAVINDSSNFTAIENLIETMAEPTFVDTPTLVQAAGGLGGTYNATAAREIVSGMASAGEAGGVVTTGLGTMEIIPAVGAIATAGYVGWKIGGAIDHWLGWNTHGATLSSTSDYGAGMWVYIRCNSASSVSKGNGNSFTWANGSGAWYAGGSMPGLTNQCGAASNALGKSFPFNIWIYNAQRTGCSAGCTGQISQGQWDNGFSCVSTCDLSGDGQNFRLYTTLENVYAQLVTQSLTSVIASGLPAYFTRDAGCSDGANFWTQPGTTNTATSTDCKGSLWRTSEQMELDHSIKTQPLTSDPCGGCGAGNAPGGMQVNPPANVVSHASCTYSSSCGVAIRNTITSHVITEKWIVHELNPTVEPVDPAIQTNFTVLQPLPNETYSAYITRLQGQGYVGTFTSTQEPTALTGYGPNAVTRIQFTGNDSTVHTLDPLSWPGTVPQMKTDTPVVIRYNPSTATPAATDSAGNSCGTTANPCITEDNTPSPGDSPCDTCAIDWTPIEDLNVGTKFPFGVPTWFHDFFNGLSFSGSCSQSLDLNEDNPAGSPPISVPFCNAAWEDTYRPIVFPILEALMTLAAVTFLGVKIFGIGGGDNG